MPGAWPLHSLPCNTFFPAAGVRKAPAFTRSRVAVRQVARPQITCMATSMQFIVGVEEPTIPDVKLTRSRDGSSGVATFTFQNPSVFEASSEVGDITGLYLVDDEGTLQTVEVQVSAAPGCKLCTGNVDNLMETHSRICA